nr:hypothetical protein [Lachnospiraceae bacterium]
VPAAKGAGESYREHNDVNIWDNMVYSYMAERPQRLFLLETSATVNRTIPVFQRNDTERNVMLMGGWMYGSPLQSEKIRAFGYTDVQDMFSRGGVSVLYLQDLPWVLMVSDPRGRWKGLYPEDLEMYLKEQYDIGMEREAKSIYRSVGVSPDAYSEEIHCIYEYKLERN